jgi:hypothetical protein
VVEGDLAVAVPGEDKEYSPSLSRIPGYEPVLFSGLIAIIQNHFIKGDRRYKSAQTI